MARQEPRWDTLAAMLAHTPAWYEGKRQPRRKRIELRYVTHANTQRIDIRKWYVHNDGTWQPGRDGCTVPVGVAEELFRTLVQAGQAFAGVRAEVDRTIRLRAGQLGHVWEPARAGEELVVVPARELGEGLGARARAL